MIAGATAGAFLFEDVGVTAFHGAIPAVKEKKNLELLAGIAPVEAYHAAILRTLLYQKGLEMVTPYNIRVFDFVQVSTQGASLSTVAFCSTDPCADTSKFTVAMVLCGAAQHFHAHGKYSYRSADSTAGLPYGLRRCQANHAAYNWCEPSVRQAANQSLQRRVKLTRVQQRWRVVPGSQQQIHEGGAMHTMSSLTDGLLTFAGAVQPERKGGRWQGSGHCGASSRRAQHLVPFCQPDSPGRRGQGLPENA